MCIVSALFHLYMCSFLLYWLWLPCFVLTPEEAEMGYGLRQHETDGYKSPQSISKALMNKGDHAAPRTRSRPVAFLHPAPAKRIFKDLGENFSISTSILLCGKLIIGAWKIPRPPPKEQFQTSPSSHRGIIAESFTFITLRRHKVLWLQSSLAVLNPSARPFSLQSFVLSWSLTLPGEATFQQTAFPSQPHGRVTQWKLSLAALDSSICGGMAADRCASTACYRAKVTRCLDGCHWLS